MSPRCVRRSNLLAKAHQRGHCVCYHAEADATSICIEGQTFPGIPATAANRSCVHPPCDPITVNKYINPVSDLNGGSGNGLQLDWARADALPLSAAQLGIWFAQRIDFSASTYNIGEYIEIEGSIDPILFERALEQVICETEALGLRIAEQAGGPWQVVGASPACSMPVIDVSAETDARAAAEAWMKTDLARPIEPTRGPLFGFALFKASPDRFFWYARYHHIIMDAFGMWLVARRLAQVYTRLSIDRSAHEEFFWLSRCSAQG